MMIWHDGSWSRAELQRMADGEFIDRNGKRYAVCQDCGSVIRMDKPLLGSMHSCEPPSKLAPGPSGGG